MSGMELDMDVNERGAEAPVPSTPPGETKKAARAKDDSDVCMEVAGSADLVALDRPPLPSDAIAMVTTMLEQFNVEVQADKIKKSMGRLGERMAQCGRHVTRKSKARLWNR